jgi:hypothetical protein
VGTGVSLELDGEGNPRVGYHDSTNAAVKYTWLGPSGWTSETVEGELGTAGGCVSLALAKQAPYTPHVSYYAHEPYYDLKYAWRGGTSWVSETVDSYWNVGQSSSLELDPNGYPHISYRDSLEEDLKYAWWTGSGWGVRVVDSAGEVGRYSSLALDSRGNAHISYHDWINGDLKYARVVRRVYLPLVLRNH